MPSVTHLDQSVRRRTVLATGAAGAGVATLAAGATAPAEAAGRRYFQHGVASGDPMPHRVVIWTRLTPTAASAPGSGKGPRVEVTWEVAKDPRFRKVVRRGTVTTGPDRDHTVKVDVAKLSSGTWYFYRFRYRGAASRVGRMRTAPGLLSLPGHLRFGVVSCANLQAGWFTAYRALAKREDLHAVLHLGDYLYEYGPGQYGYGFDNVDIRKHQPAHEMVSLSDYRQRHAQYKRDPDLQQLHAKYPFIVTWDDHEVTNDQWRDGADNHTPGSGEGGEGDYKRRRARAHRAYDEWMPARMDGTAALRDGARLYRRLTFGRLAEISMLDLRTYRDEQKATAVSNPDRTLTGRQQMRWLKQSLSRKRVQWKIIGNPVMIAPVTFAQVPDEILGPINDVTGLLPADGQPYNVDQWDGYTDDRREVLAHIRDHAIKDALFVTGDIHSGWACELPYDPATYPLQGDSAGVEFVCSSVTSNNLKDITGTPRRTTSLAVEALIQTNNRHIKYLNFDDHGFSVLDINAKRAQMDWFVIGDRADKTTTVSHTASWRTLSGTGKVESVDRPVG